MKPLFALAALCLLGGLPLHASQDAPGGLVPDKLKPRGPVFSGLARLGPAVHEPMPGWNTGPLPRWQVNLRGQTFYLVFDGKKDLEQRVEKNRDVWWWKVRGRAEWRMFTLGRLPARPGNPVLQDARVVWLNVLIVEALETTPLESLRPAEPVRVTVRAEVRWYGNAYGRMGNGVVIGTTRAYPWEACYIVLDGRKVRVQGLPGDTVTQQNYHGQTLVLNGRLERQEGGPNVPADVLIVERFRRE